MTTSELENLIHDLSLPDRYPFAADGVDVRQTHISVVFLAGPFVYKIKKPVSLGFLDFSTLEKRRFFCEEEVRLNRRLAPAIYRGTVPVTKSEGRYYLEGPGPTVEWAVKMQRLPDSATLRSQLCAGQINEGLLERLGTRLAIFHQQADSSAEISAYGRFEIVAQNARENFQQTRSHIGRLVSSRVHARLERLTEDALMKLRPSIDARAQRGVPRDTHGDLHTNHIYLFADRTPPNDLVIIDCIEFNKRFRYADPVADMAFLYMDLKYLGFPDLAIAFANAYFAASGDGDGRTLLDSYSAYRAIVRAKVDGFESDEAEVPEDERQQAMERSRRHWILALGELENVDSKPCLILAIGLPGTGKSTLAGELIGKANVTVIRSDFVRKEIAGLQPHQSAKSGFEQGIYDPTFTDRTYTECLRQAELCLADGRRVVIDASFNTECRRRQALDLAARYCVPIVIFHCTASPQTVRIRLAHRHVDASDADWDVYQRAAYLWEPFGAATRQALIEIPTDGKLSESTRCAEAHLRALALLT